MKRILALILVLSMLLCCAVSCDDGGSTVNESEAEGVAKEYEITDREFTDYKGYDYRVLTVGSLGGSHWAAYEFHYDDKITGDALNEAVKERDNAVGTLHNITVSYLEKENVTEFARQSILSGADEFDLITANLSGAATLSRESMLINLRDYDDVLNLDADYWDQRANESLDIYGHLYFTCSDLTLIDKQATWVVFFTKSLLAKYPELTKGYESIYEMVEKGEWTIEKMYNMVKAVSAENGDGVWTNEDVYGHFGEGFSVRALMIGCGAVCIQKNSADEYVYALNDHVEDLVSSYKYVVEITSGDYSMSSGEMSAYVQDVWVEGAGGMMEKDKVLFNLTGMNRCRLYRNLEAEFGILPMPKANEEQENYQMLMTSFANSVAIPINAADKVRSCEILETMTYLASKTTYYAYIEQSLKGKYLRDDGSEAMLDIIFDSRRYDIGDVFGGFGASQIVGNIPSPDTVASFIKKQETRCKKTLERFLSNMEEVFEKTARQ